ncbi:sulfur oxidation c-type cytochrome SoxA [Sphaerotilus sp.]|uniref:sulfur oxidation c-type cytochrome SoxA n=1 Tax=Sphaerotilus sp. TaxID=2093942 RepID=UPI002ACD66DA|nr:sulfur oxidation c-type cytochrome SoxA [Sphaerotilus sp.]MDZ7856278.1 sulfur oxidation c-type cytochrome SoxA [Sphaerotilus sp.]
MNINAWAIAAVATAGLAQPLLAQDQSDAGIAAYRAALQDGNPAELWEMRGEVLWKTKRGTKNASLETCDLGKGPGKLEGAYAELPRYFADARKVMDLEARLVYCMETLQGWDTKPYFNKGAFKSKGPGSDMAAIATFVAAKSNGMAFKVDTSHPAVNAAVKTGEDLFWRRSGPFDFSCATCHAEDGKRIRLQGLPNLLKTEGAATGVATWPAYRVSQSEVRTLQHRMWDCYWQMRHPDVQYTSDAVTALLTYMNAIGNGNEIKSPYIKR